MNKKIFVIILLLVFLIGCSDKTKYETNEDSTSTKTDPNKIKKTKPEEGSRTGDTVEFNMVAKRWEFQPSAIKVNKGDKVKINIESVDVLHGFAISDFNVNSNLYPGQTTTVKFIANKTGTFSFFCSVSCGSGHFGMKGVLIVE
jgi:cytochrome c oxidase subunit II